MKFVVRTVDRPTQMLSQTAGLGVRLDGTIGVQVLTQYCLRKTNGLVNTIYLSR